MFHVYPAEDSHEISSLIFPKKKNNEKVFRMSSAAVMISALKVGSCPKSDKSVQLFIFPFLCSI